MWLIIKEWWDHQRESCLDMFSAYNGMAAGFFNGDWGVLLTALASNNKNDILATPSIVTLDNKLASFNVGQDVPVLSGSQTTSGDNVFNTVERKTVGTNSKLLRRSMKATRCCSK